MLPNKSKWIGLNLFKREVSWYVFEVEESTLVIHKQGVIHRVELPPISEMYNLGNKYYYASPISLDIFTLHGFMMSRVSIYKRGGNVSRSFQIQIPDSLYTLVRKKQNASS